MKIVLVTGASSGIGKSAALRLAESGFHVLAGVRKASDAESWRSIPYSEPVMLDVTSEESVSPAIEALSATLRQASEVHLVNNAGIAVAGPVEAVKLARWREQFEVNVFGLVRVTQALLPFIRATRGRIVNVSSVSGLATTPFLGPYSASKFAVEAISDALWLDSIHSSLRTSESSLEYLRSWSGNHYCFELGAGPFARGTVKAKRV